MKKDKKARASNVTVFGSKFEDGASAGDYKRLNKTLPKRKTDIGRITAHLCSEIETKDDPTSVAKAPLEVFRAMYNIGTRENIQFLDSVICPHCEEEHKIECTHCGKTHELDILDSSKEKNSITCLGILASKWFPNKAPIANDFDEINFVEKITDFVSKVISVLSKEHQKTYTEMWVKLVSDLEDGQ